MFVLVLGMAAPFASAGNNVAPRAVQHGGLMWNRSGLPAVFPLQVKTPPGQNYFLRLIDEDTDDAVLAAYIVGGAFFKVLVPPGVFTLRFASGDVWQGEDELFGPGANTHHFELRNPLSFETRGIGIKAGHVVNLLGHEPGQNVQVTLKDQFICQSIWLEFPSSIYSDWEKGQAHGLRYQGLTGLRYENEANLNGGVSDRSRLRTDLQRYSTLPRYDVRSQYCGRATRPLPDPE